MWRIAIALVSFAAAACANDGSVTFTITMTVQRASTEIRIDGATVDGGGPAPRYLSADYQLTSWPDGANMHYLIESFFNGSKLGELTVTPLGCRPQATSERDEVTVSAAGAITLDTMVCMP